MVIKKIIANFSLLFLLFFIANCSNSGKQPNAKKKLKQIKDTKQQMFETKEIMCDTIFKEKGYKIILRRFNIENNDEKIPNTLFLLSKTTNGQDMKVYSDSIFNTVQKVLFVDFNSDHTKDILIQNYSDVRSNWTYNLYIIDTEQNSLKKIKGFENIKNPEYIPEHNLIYNYVTSGTNWTGFYKIKGDSIIDYGISIDDNQKNDDSYSRSFNRAIKLLVANQNAPKH
jgi:hypothetical protein